MREGSFDSQIAFHPSITSKWHVGKSLFATDNTSAQIQ